MNHDLPSRIQIMIKYENKYEIYRENQSILKQSSEWWGWGNGGVGNVPY